MEPDEVRKAIGTDMGGNAYFYQTAAPRDHGLTPETSTAEKIALTLSPLFSLLNGKKRTA